VVSPVFDTAYTNETDKSFCFFFQKEALPSLTCSGRNPKPTTRAGIRRSTGTCRNSFMTNGEGFLVLSFKKEQDFFFEGRRKNGSAPPSPFAGLHGCC
jgi:hypothetical protein